MEELSIVYVLTNSAMPGLVKIGKTSHEAADDRIAQLYTTGVPVPFTIEYACKVYNAREVEEAIHTAFAPNGINPKREFFQIDPYQVIAILKLLNTEDATDEIARQESRDIDPQSLAAAEQMRTRRPNLNFEEMAIPVGAVLQCVDNDATVIVTGAKKVRLNDEERSLTAATKQVIGLPYDIQPSPRWTCQGRLLSDIYEETYGESE